METGSDEPVLTKLWDWLPDHLEITKDPAFTDNILYFLLESPRNAPTAGGA